LLSGRQLLVLLALIAIILKLLHKIEGLQSINFLLRGGILLLRTAEHEFFEKILSINPRIVVLLSALLEIEN
jgi:hypothetical protein